MHMTTTVGEMTPLELREMIDFIIEQKLQELLGDPDERLDLREVVAARLQRQRQEVAAGERGMALSALKDELGFN